MASSTQERLVRRLPSLVQIIVRHYCHGVEPSCIFYYVQIDLDGFLGQ